MRTGRYSLAELFGNRHIDQLVIPEIQRDYVWTPTQVTHLLTSILENFEAWQREKAAPPWQVVASHPSADADPAESGLQALQEEFAAFHARRTRATNVGFVYAYCDGDLPGQYFLIDGQQRLTTLYLCLLSVASSQTELKERFRARYCLASARDPSGKAATPTKLDYRLREYTAEFLHQCVRYLLDHPESADQLKDQNWYLERNDGDATIRNLLTNFTVICGQLRAALSGTHPARLYEYLEDLVECWYFDTNESAQGEELYLYLNARGESIADNENRKALLLSAVGDPDEKSSWGRKWEGWQDYFWQHRAMGLGAKVDNPNADRGFNSFLFCIEQLEKLRYREEAAAGTIPLLIIEKYFEVLCWLEKEKRSFGEPYGYAGWIEEWFTALWEAFNQPNAITWDVSLSDNTKSTVHNRMVLVWGSLLCVGCALEKHHGIWEEIDRKQVFRAIRIFYLRYHNFGRQVAGLPDTVHAILSHDPTVLGNEEDAGEESAKWDFLEGRREDERRAFESVIWEIEDHPLNRNGGRGLGGTNLTHLVDLTQNPGVATLEKIRDRFNELLPPKESGPTAARRKVAAILLYYGVFWHQVSPWYYSNYDLGDWPRTIRDKGNREPGGSAIFRHFFDDFMRSEQNLDKFLAARKGTVPINPAEERNLVNALIWYHEKTGLEFLSKGMHIAVATDEQRNDVHFANLSTIWNTKGDFKGTYWNRKLADLIPGGS